MFHIKTFSFFFLTLTWNKFLEHIAWSSNLKSTLELWTVSWTCQPLEWNQVDFDVKVSKCGDSTQELLKPLLDQV